MPRRGDDVRTQWRRVCGRPGRPTGAGPPEALPSEAEDLVVPAGVLAEGLLTGHPHRDFHVRRLLELTRIADIDAGLGYAAGRLHTAVVAARPARPPSGIDAVVAAVAVDRAAGDDVVLVTSDVDDLARLLSVTEAQRVTIQRV